MTLAVLDSSKQPPTTLASAIRMPILPAVRPNSDAKRDGGDAAIRDFVSLSDILQRSIW